MNNKSISYNELESEIINEIERIKGYNHIKLEMNDRIQLVCTRANLYSALCNLKLARSKENKL